MFVLDYYPRQMSRLQLRELRPRSRCGGKQAVKERVADAKLNGDPLSERPCARTALPGLGAGLNLLATMLPMPSSFAASQPAVNPGKRNYLVSWCPKLDFCLQTKMQFARVRPMPAIPYWQCTCERDRRSSRATASGSARCAARYRRSRTRQQNAGRPRGPASRLWHLAHLGDVECLKPF